MLTVEFSHNFFGCGNTTRLRYSNRLMFVVKIAPAIFNANMHKLTHSCNGIGPIKAAQMVDDVCLTDKSPSEYFDSLAEFIFRLYACGLEANLAKCSFYKDEVIFFW